MNIFFISRILKRFILRQAQDERFTALNEQAFSPEKDTKYQSKGQDERFTALNERAFSPKKIQKSLILSLSKNGAIKINSKIIIAAILLITKTICATDHYDLFNLSQKDIQATLAKTIATPCTNKEFLPADITFGCADIKYKDGQLKFCECGDGIYMSYRTADIVLNDKQTRLVSPYWGIFWHYLAQFDLPIWHVEMRGPKHAMALEELTKIGGKHVDTLALLAQDPIFKKLAQRRVLSNHAIKNYLGIIVYCCRNEKLRSGKPIQDFKKRYPQFLYVNHFARPFLVRKNNTYNLFENAKLSEFVPQSNEYSTTYTPALTEKILKDFPTTKTFVIKPVFSSLACGVNVIARTDLDVFLKLILKDRSKLVRETHRCFVYWRLFHPDKFVISEYAPSKEIIKDGNPFDPTMRIVYIMHQDKGIMHVNVVAGFWKIPVKSLAAKKASLTEKHVTIAHAGAYFSGILADKKDWAEIETILHELLPQLYQTMLILKHP